jgi:hypothetical protein
VKITKIGTVGTLIATLATLTACSGSSGHSSGNAITDQQQGTQDTQYAYVQPLPYFPFSQIRQTVIEAEAADALGVSSTAFFFMPGITHPVLVCPAIGVPVPATDQLSNPQKVQWGYSGSSGVAGATVGQEEPDGVFTGDTSGTNVLCVNGAGTQYLGYDEAYTIAVTSTAYWDNASGTIKVTGAPQMPKCTVHKLAAGKAEEVCVKP